MSVPRTSVVLKLLNGTAQHERGAARDDRLFTPADKHPLLPPWVKLDAAEQKAFDYLLAEFLLPTVHGRPDGLLIATLAQRMVLRDKALKALKRSGPTHRHPLTNNLLQHPNVAIYKNHDDAVRRMMLELGFSPDGRRKHAPPLGSNTPASPWDNVS